MKRILTALMALMFIATCTTAFADKARGISSAEDEAFHTTHLLQHQNDATCHVTGNYIKIRTKADSNAKVIGHLEQADTFILLDFSGNYALIRVLISAPTSPDSTPEMEGWVNASYVDCLCTEAAYRSNSTEQHTLSSGLFPQGTPTRWYFASGAGGWATEITIAENGSFTGYYHDWDGGNSDLYPHGELQECSFTGKFSIPEPISQYEYRIIVTELHESGTPGETFVRDGQLVTTAHAYGISEGATFILYLPGTPLNRLTPAHHEWAYVRSDDWHILDFALYNMTSAYGWSAQ